MDFESKNDEQASAMSCGNTKKASILLVRKLYTLMQNLGPLPDSVCLNMKLAYYEDVTPEDYQPPGFKTAEGDTLEFEKEPVKLTMGEVVTPFHTLKLDMATERQRLEQVEESVHVTEKWVLHMEEEGVLSEVHVIEDVEKPDDEDLHLDLDCTEIQMSCHEKMESLEEATEMDTEVKESPDGPRRTRSGRIIRSTTETKLTVNNGEPTALKDRNVSRYDVPGSSQETPSSSAPSKRRRFSEPKERF